MNDAFAMVAASLIIMLPATIRLATPLLIAATGEGFSQRTGVLNVGLEGYMTLGAFLGIAGSFYFGNPWIGALLAMVAGISLALVHGYLSISRGVDQIVAGIGIMFVGMGITEALRGGMFGRWMPRPDTFKPIEVPLLSDIPGVGPILFDNPLLVYVSWILVAALAIAIFKTSFGLNATAVGENPLAAETLGVRVQRTRYACLMVSGLFAGLSGAFLSLGILGTYIPHMVAGRGFIALALVVVGGWNPAKILVGSLIFAGTDALAFRMQVIGSEVPFPLLLMLPYITTIVFLVATARRITMPSQLAVPYVRER